MDRCPPWKVSGEPGPDELPTLDALEAFDAMRSFIESYWEEGGKAEEELLRLLSGIDRDAAIRPDGGTLDPGKWGQWVRAIREVKKG